MEFISPTSLEQALEELRTHGGDAALVAGGTSARYQIVSGQIKAKVVLHIERISEVSGISGNGVARLGAVTSLRDIAEDTDILSRFAAVATAAGKCGGWQTQGVATVGGNVCGASPSADLTPPLMVQEAQIELQSRARGRRTLSLGEFLLGAYRTARQPDEMATAFLLPPPPPRSADIYVKIQRRSAMERPIIGLALRLAMDESLKHIQQVRIAVSGAGPMPFRVPEAEDLLIRSAPGKEAVRAAADAILKRGVFTSDARASASYRAAVLPRAFAHAMSVCSSAIADSGA